MGYLKSTKPRRTSKTDVRRTRRVRLEIEAIEERTLLSGSPAPYLLYNPEAVPVAMNSHTDVIWVSGLGGNPMPPSFEETLEEHGDTVYWSDWNNIVPYPYSNTDPGSISANWTQGASLDLGNPTNYGGMVQDLAQFINALPASDKVVLIGHSLGGAAVLATAEEAYHSIALLATLDPVGQGGFRHTLPRTVPSNVEYFYDRWQTMGMFPIDYTNPPPITSYAYGSLLRDFGIPDQQQENDSGYSHANYYEDPAILSQLTQITNAIASARGGTPATGLAVTTLTASTTGTSPTPATVAVAWFPATGPSDAASNYAATIQWGDGLPPSAGTIVSDPDGGFYVYGAHSFEPYIAEEFFVPPASFDLPFMPSMVGQWVYYKVAVRIEGPGDISYGTASQASVYDPGYYAFGNQGLVRFDEWGGAEFANLVDANAVSVTVTQAGLVSVQDANGSVHEEMEQGDTLFAGQFDQAVYDSAGNLYYLTSSGDLYRIDAKTGNDVIIGESLRSLTMSPAGLVGVNYTLAPNGTAWFVSDGELYYDDPGQAPVGIASGVTSFALAPNGQGVYLVTYGTLDADINGAWQYEIASGVTSFALAYNGVGLYSGYYSYVVSQGDLDIYSFSTGTWSWNVANNVTSFAVGPNGSSYYFVNGGGLDAYIYGQGWQYSIEKLSGITAFDLAYNGVGLYSGYYSYVVSQGDLDIYSFSTGTWSWNVANNVTSFAVGPNGSSYYFVNGGGLDAYIYGQGWQYSIEKLSGITAFGLAYNAVGLYSGYYAYVVSQGDLDIYSFSTGTWSWNVANNVTSFAVGPNGSSYYFVDGGGLDAYIYGQGWQYGIEKLSGITAFDLAYNAVGLYSGYYAYVVSQGDLDIYSFSTGTWSLNVANNVTSFAVGPNGSSYYFVNGGGLDAYIYGQGWQYGIEQLSGITAFDLAYNAVGLYSGYYAYVVSQGDLDIYSFSTGTWSLNVANNVTSFAVGPNGSSYYFVNGGGLDAYIYGQGWQYSIEKLSGITAFDLAYNSVGLYSGYYSYVVSQGDLDIYSFSTGTWSLNVANNVTSFAVGPNGSSYYFVDGGTLDAYIYGQGWQYGIQSGVKSFVLAPDNSGYYFLTTSGALDYDEVGIGVTTLATQVSSFSLSSDGQSFYVLNSGGTLESYTYGVGWSVITSGVQSFVLGPGSYTIDILQNSQNSGDLWQYTTSGKTLLDQGVVSISLTNGGYTLDALLKNGTAMQFPA